MTWLLCEHFLAVCFFSMIMSVSIRLLTNNFLVFHYEEEAIGKCNITPLRQPQTRRYESGEVCIIILVRPSNHQFGRLFLEMRKTLPKKIQTAIFGRLLCFGQILFYHCLNSCNEEVFGQKKNPRYLPQNISLDDEAERYFDRLCSV